MRIRTTVMDMKACFMQAFFYLILLSLGGCHSLESRKETAEILLKQKGQRPHIIYTSSFPLYSVATNIKKKAEAITIFIEGDGYAWVDRYNISDNPTPINPVALRLTLREKNNAIYLARPCQYVSTPNCNSSYWAYNRFAPEIINTYIDAVNQIVDKYNPRSINLVGYSGGAYIAFILASKRTDIKKVTTVAGLLDPDQWTSFHNISPLYTLENKNDLLKKTSHVKFVHICSHDDNVIPCSLTRYFVMQGNLQDTQNHLIVEKHNVGHDDLWSDLNRL